MVVLDGILVCEHIPPVGAFPTVSNFVENVLRHITRPVQPLTRDVEVVFVKNGHVLLGIEQLWTLVNVRPTYSTIVAELYLTGLTLLGSNENHTVSSTCTIDGSGCSIFQHVDALDIVRVDTIKVATSYTVNNIKRCIVADGALTTDVNIVTLTRL